jgi:hypothetical protein
MVMSPDVVSTEDAELLPLSLKVTRVSSLVSHVSSDSDSRASQLPLKAAAVRLTTTSPTSIVVVVEDEPAEDVLDVPPVEVVLPVVEVDSLEQPPQPNENAMRPIVKCVLETIFQSPTHQCAWPLSTSFSRRTT